MTIALEPVTRIVPGALDGARRAASTLLIGIGLTMVDVAINLASERPDLRMVGVPDVVLGPFAVGDRGGGDWPDVIDSTPIGSDRFTRPLGSGPPCAEDFDVVNWCGGDAGVAHRAQPNRALQARSGNGAVLRSLLAAEEERAGPDLVAIGLAGVHVDGRIPAREVDRKLPDEGKRQGLRSCHGLDGEVEPGAAKLAAQRPRGRFAVAEDVAC